MNKVRLALLATAATGVIAATGLAFAANNDAFVEQNGNSNTASINQTNAGAETQDNKLGSDTNVVLQDGSQNTLDIIQSGDGNQIGLQDSGVDQLGDGNNFEALQSSSSNIIGSVQQVESTAAGATGTNALTITQKGGASNLVTAVSQETTANGTNSSGITQNGAGNRLKSLRQFNNGAGTNAITVSITGDDNGTADRLTYYASNANVSSSEISQSGTDNTIELTITGNSNQFGVAQTNDTGGTNILKTLDVVGDLNEIGVSQTAHSATDTNDLTIEKVIGNSNKIGVRQEGFGSNTGTIDLGADSDNNWARLTQKNGATAKMTITTGDFNRMTIDQSGASTVDNNAEITVTSSNAVATNNVLSIRQANNGDVAKTTVVGDYNTSIVNQAANYNEATITITGDNNYNKTNQNSFSTNNTETVTLLGNQNSVDSHQTGIRSGYNDATFYMEGDSNIFKSVQRGSTASLIDVKAFGDGNQFDTTQLSSNSDMMMVTIYGDNNGKGAWSLGSAVADVGLTSGELEQSGSNNMMDISIGSASLDSSNNLVAALQNGDGNSIDVSISDGSFNEVAISQQGNGNISVVNQVGSSNIVGIRQ